METWNQQVSVGHWYRGAGERLKPRLGAPPSTTIPSLLLLLLFPLPSHPLSTALCDKPFLHIPTVSKNKWSGKKTFQIPLQNNEFNIFSLQMENASCQERGLYAFLFSGMCISSFCTLSKPPLLAKYLPNNTIRTKATFYDIKAVVQLMVIKCFLRAKYLTYWELYEVCAHVLILQGKESGYRVL